jgi:hypothetical protein
MRRYRRIASGSDVVTRAARAWEPLGVEFLNGDRPGVRINPVAAVAPSLGKPAAVTKPARRKPGTDHERAGAYLGGMQ